MQRSTAKTTRTSVIANGSRVRRFSRFRGQIISEKFKLLHYTAAKMCPRSDEQFVQLFAAGLGKMLVVHRSRPSWPCRQYRRKLVAPQLVRNRARHAGIASIVISTVDQATADKDYVRVHCTVCHTKSSVARTTPDEQHSRLRQLKYEYDNKIHSLHTTHAELLMTRWIKQQQRLQKQNQAYTRLQQNVENWKLQQTRKPSYR